MGTNNSNKPLLPAPAFQRIAVTPAWMVLMFAIICLLAGSSWADAPQTPGVSDTEIILGQTMPYSGPASAYGTIGRTQAAYFRYLNDAGGINGRRIRLISLDDGYSPPRTVDQVRRLIEHDGVFALFQTLGATTNSAVIQYTNARQVPSLFIGSIVDKHADGAAYPWTITWNPPASAEGRAYAQWVMTHHPNARIAVLYQNDDLGKDLSRSFRRALESQTQARIVGEATYDLGDPSIDSQIITLKATRADTFFMAGTPKYGALAIRAVRDLQWQPMFIVNNAMSSIEAVLKPAGLDKAVGLLSAGYYKSDPEQYEGDADVRAYLAMMKKYYPEANAYDGINVYGYVTALAVTEVLRRCGRDLTRDAVIREATRLRDVQLPMLYEGITLNTTPGKHAPIDRLRMQRFDGQHWQLQPDSVSSR